MANSRLAKGVAVRFRRPRGVLPLPVPQRGGDIATLRRFVNLPNDADWQLFVAWLIMALRPRGPYPVLRLHGRCLARCHSEANVTVYVTEAISSRYPARRDVNVIRRKSLA